MKRHALFFLLAPLVWLAASLLTPAWARPWTDTQGNRFEATFLRFEGESAVLLRSGQVLTLPLNELSNEDLRYLRRDLELAGLGHLVPPLGASVPEPEARRDESTPGKRTPSAARPAAEQDTALDAGDPGRVLDGQPLRAWTDAQGRKIVATLQEIRDDGVVLLMNGQKFTVPLSRLSRLDQRYVERLEREADSADRTAAASEPAPQPAFPSPPVPAPNLPGFGAPPVNAADVQEFAQRAEQQLDEFHQGMQEEARRMENETREQAEQLQQWAADVAEQAGAYDDPPPASASGSPPQSSPSFSEPTHDALAANVPSSRIGSSPPDFSPPSPAIAEPPRYEPEIPATAFPAGPAQGEVGLCSNCNKEVPAHIGAGQRCPHCGIYFEYEEDESGSRTYAKGGGSSRFHVSGRGMRGLVKLGILLVVGLLGFFGWLGRKLLGES